MSLSRAARSCHRRAVSRRHRARKRSLFLGDDFSIAVSPLRTNGRSGFWARRLSAFYGLFRSVFLIFSIRLHFSLLSALQMLAVFISSSSLIIKTVFGEVFFFPSSVSLPENMKLVLFWCNFFPQNHFVAVFQDHSTSNKVEKTVAPA